MPRLTFTDQLSRALRLCSAFPETDGHFRLCCILLYVVTPTRRQEFRRVYDNCLFVSQHASLYTDASGVVVYTVAPNSCSLCVNLLLPSSPDLSEPLLRRFVELHCPAYVIDCSPVLGQLLW